MLAHGLEGRVGRIDADGLCDPAMFLSGPATAAGIKAIGNLGVVVGPWMIRWIKDRTGSFAGGLMVVAGLLRSPRA